MFPRQKALGQKLFKTTGPGDEYQISGKVTETLSGEALSGIEVKFMDSTV